MEPIAIMADDLTGANDTGIKFSQNGFKTTVIIDPKTLDLVSEPNSVWAINTDTRDLSATEAYQVVYSIAESLWKLKISRVYKKIDSTLRGHPGAELEAIMDVWQAPLALVVPAIPANRRIVQQGYLVIGEDQGGKLSKQDIIKKASCYVPTVLQKEMHRTVGMIDFESVRKGVSPLLSLLQEAQEDLQVLVIDASTEADLSIIAQAVAQLPRNIVVAGAAGLAAHLSLAWKQKRLPWYPAEGAILFVAGSHNPVTGAQVSELARHTDQQPVVVRTQDILTGNAAFEVERVHQEVNNQPGKERLIILAVDTLFPSSNFVNEQSGKVIASTLGQIVSRILADMKVKGLVMTGGDTAIHICRALGATGIDLVTELLPGIPFGFLVGAGGAKLPVVTKAGGFGPPESFVKIFEYFDQIGKQEDGVIRHA
ncbi:MAG: four-carbon acid sugar kinase family protein [Desulfitobacteriaceae bacterium]